MVTKKCTRHKKGLAIMFSSAMSSSRSFLLQRRMMSSSPKLYPVGRDHPRPEDRITILGGMYEVKLGWCTYRVSLERRTCTCKKFEICGIPCEHAYGVMLQKKLAPENFVCHWFRTAMWRRNYAEGLVPVRGAPFWPCTSAPDVHIPPDPKQPGKKKITKAEKKRKKGVNESPTKKQPKHKKHIMHCGICRMADRSIL
ncbi:unnamed protein product [Brassica oleracea var. botrytis]